MKGCITWLSLFFFIMVVLAVGSCRIPNRPLMPREEALTLQRAI